MRFIRDISGIERISTKISHRPNTWRGYSPASQKEISEDTRIRREIYKKVIEMIEQGENNIKIECVLREKYPDYAGLIATMVNDQFAKRKLNRQVNNNDTEIGDER